MATMRMGFHVSIAGGISNSVGKAKNIGCTAFQIFSRNPRGWMAKALDPTDVELYRSKLDASGIDRDAVTMHMPYLPNLSGPEGEFYKKSISTLKGELERCAALGIPFLVIHLGSHMGKGTKAGIEQLSKALTTARAKVDKAQGHQRVTVLLENNSGQKNSMGSNFEELRLMLDRLGSSKGYGICLDTCHLFASGNDVRSMEGVEKTIANFSNIVGIKELRLLHLNDSKGGLNSKIDRHEHIGLGQIGREGMSAFLNEKRIRKLPIIMETPIDERRGDEENLRTVLGLIRPL